MRLHLIMSSSKRDLSFLRYIAHTHPKLPKKSVLLHKEAFYGGLEKFLSGGDSVRFPFFLEDFEEEDVVGNTNAGEE